MGCFKSTLRDGSAKCKAAEVFTACHITATQSIDEHLDPNGPGDVQKPNRSNQAEEPVVSCRLDGMWSASKNRKLRESFDPRVTAVYDVSDLIGKGSFSQVVRVEHRITRQRYAIKLIEAKEGTAAFETELAILSRIRHPYVVQLIETYRSRTRLYMVMELASGGELYDKIIKNGAFTELEAASVLRMILDGLSFLHLQGVTHRDLKVIIQ